MEVNKWRGKVNEKSYLAKVGAILVGAQKIRQAVGWGH